jgi:hypothetical protein
VPIATVVSNADETSTPWNAPNSLVSTFVTPLPTMVGPKLTHPEITKSTDKAIPVVERMRWPPGLKE